MTSVDKIDQAILQLAYAIKLDTYIDMEKLKQDEFDIDLTVTFPNWNVNYPANQFKSYDEIRNATKNNHLITLGFTAIVLDSCFEDIGMARDPKAKTPEGQLRALIYTIRNAFAHDMMHPQWDIRGDFSQKYKILLENEAMEINVTNLDGQIFNEKHLNGIETYLKIINEARNIFLRKQLPSA